MTLDEGLLIQKSIGGDKAAFISLVKMHQDKILRLCYAQTQSWHDAEEVAQDVFLKVYDKLHTFEGKSKFTSWIYRIAVNKCHDFHRKEKWKKWRQVFQKDDGADPIVYLKAKEDQRKDLEMKEERHIFESLVKKLPERQRVIFELYYYQDLKGSEVAEILEISEGTVKAQLHLARSRLKEDYGRCLNE